MGYHNLTGGIMLKSVNFSEITQRALAAATDPEQNIDSGQIRLTPRKTIRFLRLPEVINMIGLSKSSIYERIVEGSFPSPIPLGHHAVGWIEEEIIGWAHDRVAQARTKTTQLQRAAA